MSKTIVHIPVIELIHLAGKKWRSYLDDLREEKLIDDYEDEVKITVDNAKAIYIQSILEFEERKKG